MEQNFQTSFIPKKPMIEERTSTPQSFGFLFLISVFVLFTVLVGSGGLFFYKSILGKNLSQMESDLNLAKNRFEPSKINQLQTLDKRLRASSQILGKHIAISPIFSALQEITMKTVRFSKFDYILGDDKDMKVGVKMSGVATSYRTIALQSDLFAKNKYFINPVFSNLSLDNSGNVLFDLEFSVDPTFIDYKDMLLRKEDVNEINIPQ